MKNIVIIGGGFAGLRCALLLEKELNRLHDDRSIILFEKNSYHTYTPALYETATAYSALSAKDEADLKESIGDSVCFAIRRVLRGKNVAFVQQEVSGVEFVSKEVVTIGGDKVPFDYLILALGSEMIYFGIKGAERCCYALKTFSDALKIRKRIEDIFKQAAPGVQVRIVLVGGGFSGVELAAEIAVYTKHLARDYGIAYSNVSISIFEASNKILADYHPALRRLVEKRLKKLGVTIRTGTKIGEALPGCVILEKGERCEADIVVWSGGIRGPALFKKFEKVELDKRGNILVDEYLRVRGQDSVFAIGDNSSFTDVQSRVTSPATAFIAEQQAEIAVYNILAGIKKEKMYKYKISIPGYITSCGGKYAVAHIYGVTFAGFFGWVLKKVVDLKYFLSLFSFSEALSLWLREIRLFSKND